VSGDSELTVVRNENGKLTRVCAAALDREADRLLREADASAGSVGEFVWREAFGDNEDGQALNAFLKEVRATPVQRRYFITRWLAAHSEDPLTLDQIGRAAGVTPQAVEDGCERLRMKASQHIGDEIEWPWPHHIEETSATDFIEHRLAARAARDDAEEPGSACEYDAATGPTQRPTRRKRPALDHWEYQVAATWRKPLRGQMLPSREYEASRLMPFLPNVDGPGESL
jgi:hypothetical protein